MTNGQIADTLEQVADLLEFQAANAFRIRAYRKAARTIRDLADSVAGIVGSDDKKLTDIDGIGKDMAAKCTELVETGSLPMLEELKAKVPASTLKMLRIPGLGPKKAAVIFNELGIASLDELKAACEAEKIRELKGFAAKTEQAILDGLAIAAAADERIYWSRADEIVADLKTHMSHCVAIEQMEMAGSYRRGKETVGDLDLLVVSQEAEQVMDHFGEFPEFVETIVRGGTKMSCRTGAALQIDLRVVPAESFGAALQYFTGSKEHNVVVRGRAKKLGLKINEYGVYRVHEDGREEYVAGETEQAVYATLDLPVIPPELRESRSEFEWSEQGALPELLTVADIQGDLHMHTTATDGKASLPEMVAAAKARGLSYIAITDHSQRVSMANGLDADRLRAQWIEVDRVNAAEGDQFTVLKGIECDILEQGGMDLPDDVLAEADWVLASVHYGQKQSAAQITERILEAIEHPHVSAIAHPTGRLINRREPYAVDMDQVFAAAKKFGKFLELNANPARLDLHDTHCAAAKRLGIPIVISTDAHSVAGLDVMRFGILQARRGGLSAVDVANTRPWTEVQGMLLAKA
jgi:DNA polymerase (family 10)